jgi:TFIIF-interacting CTD phosphatase-like protein
MDGYYIVFERPGLQLFLTFLFDNFNVSIWTAASKDYELSIIENIILKDHPDRKLEYIFFDYHTIISNNINKGCTKQIEILKTLFDIKHLKIENTVILDDNINKVYNCQKNNCIVAKPFDLLNDQKSYTEDIFLEILQVQLNILFDEFVNTKDVQPYIKNINRKLNVVKK